ncbi:MAG: hypothetical protein MI717_13555 [Spirochaetales bacterium]|nr:hypothetical protein [Spirochaetales bacterium]
MNDSRQVLRDLTIALGILAVIVAVPILFMAFRSPEPEMMVSYAQEEPPTMMEEPMTPVMEMEDQEIPRYIVTRHTVVGGESFSFITGIYWDDIYLWPDLYIRNDMISEDPDIIFPDEIIDIYNRLGDQDEFTEREREVILDAYIQVYDRFKSLGPQKDDSAWTLLWCGAKYDHNFLDLYAHRIDPADLAVAQRYIDEEGYLD